MTYHPGPTFEIGPKIGPFDHITRSRLAAQLMELHAAGQGGTAVVPYKGQDVHHQTKSIRKTMERHGYRLYTRLDREANTVTLWVTKSAFPT